MLIQSFILYHIRIIYSTSRCSFGENWIFLLLHVSRLFWLIDSKKILALFYAPSKIPSAASAVSTTNEDHLHAKRCGTNRQKERYTSRHYILCLWNLVREKETNGSIHKVYNKHVLKEN